MCVADSRRVFARQDRFRLPELVFPAYSGRPKLLGIKTELGWSSLHRLLQAAYKTVRICKVTGKDFNERHLVS